MATFMFGLPGSRAAYADGNGTIDKDELKSLLKDAGIGSGLTR